MKTRERWFCGELLPSSGHLEVSIQYKGHLNIDQCQERVLPLDKIWHDQKWGQMLNPMIENVLEGSSFNVMIQYLTSHHNNFENNLER